ncbi:10694_t:CDS:2 [Acaulospora morrowiae]|uniref:10694_t:CDS:1 n=1 Tax=Acaulospora morrowiae TaxID=94023 RepID=A0A9N9G811_9GLOM|nr:10694_t:CDS:2 [Acaulospora morrowiae]
MTRAIKDFAQCQHTKNMESFFLFHRSIHPSFVVSDGKCQNDPDDTKRWHQREPDKWTIAIRRRKSSKKRNLDVEESHLSRRQEEYDAQKRPEVQLLIKKGHTLAHAHPFDPSRRYQIRKVYNRTFLGKRAGIKGSNEFSHLHTVDVNQLEERQVISLIITSLIQPNLSRPTKGCVCVRNPMYACGGHRVITHQFIDTSMMECFHLLTSFFESARAADIDDKKNKDAPTSSSMRMKEFSKHRWNELDSHQ